VFDRMLAELRAAADAARTDAAAKTVADMVAVGQAIGLTAR
jgi:hypothetical protein